MTTNEGTAFDPELMAAVTELGRAVRSLVDASVRTTVGPAELRAAATSVRTVTEELSVAQRPASQLPALDDPIAFRGVDVRDPSPAVARGMDRYPRTGDARPDEPPRGGRRCQAVRTRSLDATHTMPHC